MSWHCGSQHFTVHSKKKNTKKIGGMHSEEKRGPIILSSPSYPPPHDLTVPLENSLQYHTFRIFLPLVFSAIALFTPFRSFLAGS